MTRIVISATAEKTPGDQKVLVKTYAWKEGDNADRVRLNNMANACLRNATFDGEQFIQGMPPDSAERIWDVYLNYRQGRRGGLPKVDVDYHKYDTCPNAMAEVMMEVVKSLRRNIRTFDERKKQDGQHAGCEKENAVR